ARIAARTSVSAARCAGWNRRIRPRGRTRRTRSSSSHSCSKGTIAPDPASFAPPKRPGPRPLGPGPFLVRSTWPCAEGEIEICGCVDMEALSQAYRALGDATRLRILRLIAQTPLNVSELVSLVGIAQPSVSHHLGKLKAMKLLA